jgi:hypothetical protein
MRVEQKVIKHLAEVFLGNNKPFGEQHNSSLLCDFRGDATIIYNQTRPKSQRKNKNPVKIRSKSEILAVKMTVMDKQNERKYFAPLIYVHRHGFKI